MHLISLVSRAIGHPQCSPAPRSRRAAAGACWIAMCLVLFSSLFSTARPLHAQTFYGSISGVVKDPLDKPKGVVKCRAMRGAAVSNSVAAWVWRPGPSRESSLRIIRWNRSSTSHRCGLVLRP